MVPGMAIVDPEADTSTERIMVALFTPMDIRITEITPMIVLPTIPTTAKEEV